TASAEDIACRRLIYFVVRATVPKDKGLALVLAEPGEEAQVSQRNILHLIIQPTGVVDVRRGESQQVQQMRASEIEGLWRQEVAANENLIAAVKTHPDAPYAFMVDVLDALHAANAQRISLQILE